MPNHVNPNSKNPTKQLKETLLIVICSALIGTAVFTTNKPNIMIITLSLFQFIALIAFLLLIGFFIGFATLATLNRDIDFADFNQLEADSNALKDIAAVLANMEPTAKYIDIIDAIDITTCNRIAEHAHH